MTPIKSNTGFRLLAQEEKDKMQAEIIQKMRETHDRSTGEIEMTKIDDGGNAFPSPDRSGRWGQPESSAGMTLRDWFAGQALAGMSGGPNPANAASLAYQYADAMVAARKETK